MYICVAELRRDHEGAKLSEPYTGCSISDLSYCATYVAELVRRSNILANVLKFTIRGRSGIVACNLATHRPVGAGKVQELFFYRRVKC